MTTTSHIPEDVLAIFDPMASATSNQVFRFAIEAELDTLLDVIERVEEWRPELFRETECCRDVLDNLHGMIEAGAGC